MLLVLLLLVVSVVLGLALGGRIGNLADLKLRYWPLALVGYGLQVLPYPESWGRNIPIAGLLLSFVLLVAFALANWRLPGFAMIVAGVMMNFLVISANWGMPVSAEALVASDQEDVLRDLRREPGQKHHLASEDDELMFLADVIPIPNPIHLAISVGDVFMYTGVGVLIVESMGPRRRPARHRSSSTGTEP